MIKWGSLLGTSLVVSEGDKVNAAQLVKRFGFEGGEWMHLRDLKEEKEKRLGGNVSFLVGLGLGEMVVFMEEIVAAVEVYMVVAGS